MTFRLDTTQRVLVPWIPPWPPPDLKGAGYREEEGQGVSQSGYFRRDVYPRWKGVYVRQNLNKKKERRMLGVQTVLGAQGVKADPGWGGSSPVYQSPQRCLARWNPDTAM